MKIKKIIILLIISVLIFPVFGRTCVSGSAESRVSIIELFTATWCTFCPAAEKALSERFASENGSFIFVEYHLGDSLSTKDTTNRGYFYGITGTPTAVVNGAYKFIGTSRIKSVGLDRAIDDSKETPAVSFLKLDTFIINNRVNVETTVESSTGSPLTLSILLVEDKVAYKNKTYRFVVRSIKQFSESEGSFSESTSFGTASDFNQENLYIVAFVQDLKTKEIYQAKEVKVSSKFSAPHLSQPSGEISSFPFNIEFTAVPYAKTYEIQFATDSFFYTVVRDEKISSSTFAMKKDDFISGKYFVRVRALKDGVISPWSESITLDVKVYKTIVMQIGNPFMEVNGKKEEIDPGRGTVPVIIDKWGRTVIPIRTIVESLGGEVDWDELTRTITLMFTKRQLPPSPPAYTVYIVLQIGNPQASVNGVKKWIDNSNHAVTPIIINDRTMVPLRFVMENLGCNVEWNPEDRTISIQCEQ